MPRSSISLKREPLLRQLWDNTGDKGPEITVNNIVKIVNQIGPEDERLKEAFVKIEHEKKRGDRKRCQEKKI